MARADSFWTVVDEILAEDDRYAREAYAFVVDGLEHTMRLLGERRHVSAAELLEGICRYARGQYGLMAPTVLEQWGLRTGEDIGDVVFALVGSGILSRRDGDRREDFDGAIDLHACLEKDYFEEGEN